MFTLDIFSHKVGPEFLQDFNVMKGFKRARYKTCYQSDLVVQKEQLR